MGMSRRYDKEERDSDGAMHWDTVRPVLLKEFGGRGGRNFSDRDWHQEIYEGSISEPKKCIATAIGSITNMLFI